MKTLAEKHPEAIERLQKIGFTGIPELCRLHYRNIDLERQLGTAGAVSKWMNLQNLPSKNMEIKARALIAELPEPKPETKPEPEIASAPITLEDNMLMVVCPLGSTAKVQRVLAMLGCEVEVI